MKSESQSEPTGQPVVSKTSVKSSRRKTIAAFALALLLCMGGVGYYLFNIPATSPVVSELQGKPRPAKATTAGYDVMPKPIALIPAGTVIEDSAPEGWSHLVFRSTPRPATGHLGALNDLAKRMVGLLSSNLVAKVEKTTGPDGDQYRLAEVAYGFSTPIDGKHTIVSTAKQAELGANFDFSQRIVLKKSEERLPTLMVLAKSDTMTVLDTASYILRDGYHEQVVYRNAILLNPSTGEVDTLVWFILLDEEKHYTQADTTIDWLPTNTMIDAALHVDKEYFTLGIPTEASFAMDDYRQGIAQTPMPEALQKIAAKSPLTAADAAEMEKILAPLAAELHKAKQEGTLPAKKNAQEPASETPDSASKTPAEAEAETSNTTP